MKIQEEMVDYFKELSLPSKFLSLLKFSNETAQQDCFSDGFEFSIDKEKFGLKTYSDDEVFLNSIYEFAVADDTGSTYGFWLKDSNLELDDAPIVIFGSDGGFHVVAKNFDELLQILTFDSEPMISWGEVIYYKGLDDFEPSNKSQEYCNWLKTEYSLDPVNSADTIVKGAQAVYKNSFEAWVGRFYEG